MNRYPDYAKECMKQFKIVIEKHLDGYVTYPIGVMGAIVGQGETYEEAWSDVMQRENEHGTVTPLVMPNHSDIKSGTLRAICAQVGVLREEFLAAYNQSWVTLDLAKLYRAKDNPTQVQEHYAIAHQMFTDLGAMKDVEKMENEEWWIENEEMENNLLFFIPNVDLRSVDGVESWARNVGLNEWNLFLGNAYHSNQDEYKLHDRSV